MTLGALLLGLAVALAVLLYIFAPFLRSDQLSDVAFSMRQQLEAKKEGYLQAIGALDFDLQTGKLDEAYYQMERGQLMQKAADLLSQLDQLPLEPTVDEQMERAVQGLRQIAVRPCPYCLEMTSADDRFCRHCGGAL